MQAEKAKIISQLQQDILLLQGYKPADGSAVDIGLGFISEAFPNGSFPLGAVHEFLSVGAEDTAATSGFIAGLLSPLMGSGGISLWISSARKLFPPASEKFWDSTRSFHLHRPAEGKTYYMGDGGSIEV